MFILLRPINIPRIIPYNHSHTCANILLHPLPVSFFLVAQLFCTTFISLTTDAHFGRQFSLPPTRFVLHLIVAPVVLYIRLPAFSFSFLCSQTDITILHGQRVATVFADNCVCLCISVCRTRWRSACGFALMLFLATKKIALSYATH